jgi:hypothetical protein
VTGRKAKRLRHRWNGDEAQGRRGVEDPVGPIAKSSSRSCQVPLRAELIGASCYAAGISRSGHAPILSLCRALCEAGYDPSLSLVAFRDGIEAVRVRSIGEAAKFTIEDNKHGTPRFRLWRLRGGGASASDIKSGRSDATD